MGASTASSRTTAVGYQSSYNGGFEDTAIGYSALLASGVGGFGNIALGFNALSVATGPSYNIVIGYNAGSAYAVSEQSNILIGSAGVVGEANTMRIGTQGTGNQQVNLTYVAGIEGASFTNGSATPAFTLIDTASGAATQGQLISSLTVPPGTIITKYTETIVTTSAAGATHTIDLSIGNWFEITLTANCTISFSNISATSGQGTSFTVALKQGGSGSYTVMWPGAVTWGVAGAPTLSTTVGLVDQLVFTTANNGTNVRGMTSELGFAG